jgi:hypothetical protein
LSQPEEGIFKLRSNDLLIVTFEKIAAYIKQNYKQLILLTLNLLYNDDIIAKNVFKFKRIYKLIIYDSGHEGNFIISLYFLWK